MNFSMENEKKIIDIEPKKQDIDEILNWLKEEKNTAEIVSITIKVL